MYLLSYIIIVSFAIIINLLNEIMFPLFHTLYDELYVCMMDIYACRWVFCNRLYQDISIAGRDCQLEIVKMFTYYFCKWDEIDR